MILALFLIVIIFVFIALEMAFQNRRFKYLVERVETLEKKTKDLGIE
jgi:hypothetical protein